MEVEISSNIQFDTEDMMALRTFLETRAGLRLIPRLMEDAPVLHAGGDSNSILIRSGEVRGWAQVARGILALAYPAPEFQKDGAATTYPSLVDDSKWNDGQKIETPNNP